MKGKLAVSRLSGGLRAVFLLIYWSLPIKGLFNTQAPSVTSWSNNFCCFRIDFCLTIKCSVRSIMRRNSNMSIIVRFWTNWQGKWKLFFFLLKNDASFPQEITRTSQTYRRQNQSACPACCAFLSRRARLPWHAQKMCAVTIVGTVLKFLFVLLELLFTTSNLIFDFGLNV